MTGQKIGFIGLGNIGKPMAMNLVRRGFAITAFDIRSEPLEELRTLGAGVADSPGDMAEKNDIIISMVRDTSDTERVVFGKEGLWERMRRGSTLIISSTIDSQFVRDLSRKALERGITVFDASVSGGAIRAGEGSLSIMVGGEKKSLEQYHTLFEAMGKSIFYVGSVGSGLIAKLVNNGILAVTLLGTLEGLRLGIKAGADARLLLDVVKASSGQSWVTQNWERYERNIRDYMENPKGSVIQLLYKDVDLALDLAKEVGALTPLMAFFLKHDIGGCLPGDE